jgi:hypothetical protein
LFGKAGRGEGNAPPLVCKSRLCCAVPYAALASPANNTYWPSQVGNIYQRFTSPVNDEGVVENIINFKTPASSLVFTVGARWARC